MIMEGSGLQEIFSLLYAEKSIEKMFNGKAYARAVRCHSLTRLALAMLIIDEMKLTEEEKNFFKNSEIDFCSAYSVDLSEKFNKKLEELKNYGPTAKLFIEYFEMTTLLHQFIEAERSGNWQSHLNCIQRMLPYFITSGHHLYAKSGYVYLQDMLEVFKKFTPEEKKKFIDEGLFTVRRSLKFYCGTFSDMVVEQSYMRNFHCNSGLTHGRGVTSSVVAKWINTIPVQILMSEAIEELCGITFCNSFSEQHKDSRISRIKRDNKDLEIILEWFKEHPPFPKSKELISLSTGLIATDEANCQDAQSLGLSILNTFEGKNFDQIKYKKTMKVVPIKMISSKIKHDGVSVTVNPDTIFKRMMILKNSNEDLKEYFQYELAPYPLSMFEEGGMRKGKKSDFYEFFQPIKEEIDLGSNYVHVIDGGFLLHRVVWNNDETFRQISLKYVKYIQNHYRPNSTIVFDGYPESPEEKGTKNAERNRRYEKKVSPEIKIQEDLKPFLTQEKFLVNDKNKKQLIKMICENLKSAGFSTVEAAEDADYLIVEEAVKNLKKFEKIVVVGNDIDLLVILTALPDQYNHKIFFLKPTQGKVEEKLYSLRSFVPTELTKYVSFLHAISGCDTTSSLFTKGKKTVVNIMKKHPNLKKQMSVFLNEKSTPQKIEKATEKFLVLLYGGKETDSLADCRYKNFVKGCTKTSFHLSALPPTSDAAFNHGKRTFYQILLWKGIFLDPLEWGWKRTKNGLMPVTTEKELAPKILLDTVSCKCKKGYYFSIFLKELSYTCYPILFFLFNFSLSGCTGRCGCRKSGLFCSSLCHCEGVDCQNKSEDGTETSDEEE